MSRTPVVPIAEARADWLRMLIPQLIAGGYAEMASEYTVELRRLEADAHLATGCCSTRAEALAHLAFERDRDATIDALVESGEMARREAVAERLQEWSE